MPVDVVGKIQQALKLVMLKMEYRSNDHLLTEIRDKAFPMLGQAQLCETLIEPVCGLLRIPDKDT